jgi:hypothetical protein
MPKKKPKARTSLAQAPLSELTAELKRRKSSLPRLIARREKLQREVNEISVQIASLEDLSSGEKRTPKGPGNSTSPSSPSTTIREKVATVLGKDPMRPVDIARELVARKIHAGGKSLSVQVSQALAKHDEFSNVKHGQWVNKGPK